MAEGVGFEPTNACASAVFKTAAFNHSATLPCERGHYFNGKPPWKTRPLCIKILQLSDF